MIPDNNSNCTELFIEVKDNIKVNLESTRGRALLSVRIWSRRLNGVQGGALALKNVS